MIARNKDRIVQFIQGIIKKPYLRNRTSDLMRNNTTYETEYKNVDEEEEEKSMRERRYNHNELSSDDELEHQDSLIANEPAINILLQNTKSANPFIICSEKIIPSLKPLSQFSVNERELSLAFYDKAIKDHWELFDTLKDSYKKWREGIHEFNNSDKKTLLKS